jgi:predicted nucleic acid binding AN1-type Zn finger protein
LCKECSYCTGDLCNDQGLKKTDMCLSHSAIWEMP